MDSKGGKEAGVVRRYGKPGAPVLALKQSFFTENESLLAETRRIHAIYTAQPRRTRCKNCDAKLGAVDFAKAGVGYVFCSRCSHLNGTHEDTDAFCAALYTDQGGAKYAANYSAADREAFDARVQGIYAPKAAFLRDSIGTCSVADFGDGSGHFVAALLANGFAAQGFEVSEAQVAFARGMVPGGKFTRHELDETVALAASVDADTISMIGVLEHLPDPRGVVAAIRKNKRVKHVYLSVPLFSPTAFLETAFPNVWPRHLQAGHTHLYTEQSLAWLRQEFGFELAAEWWFGLDVMDLFRSITVSIPESMRERWRGAFAPLIDPLQVVIDQAHLSSEVHQVLRVR